MKAFLINTFVIPFVLDFLKNLFSNEDLIKWKDKLISMLKELVTKSGPKWDDTTFIPMIEVLDSMLAAGANVDFILDACCELVKEIISKEPPSVWIDTVLDLVEDIVAASDTKWDDERVLPLIDRFRIALNIPDND